MKSKDLNGKTIQELQEILKEDRVALGRLRFELANKSLKDFSKIKKTKIDIARVLTAIGSVRVKNK